jgi:hypothetical protein
MMSAASTVGDVGSTLSGQVFRYYLESEYIVSLVFVSCTLNIQFSYIFGEGESSLSRIVDS